MEPDRGSEQAATDERRGDLHARHWAQHCYESALPGSARAVESDKRWRLNSKLAKAAVFREGGNHRTQPRPLNSKKKQESESGIMAPNGEFLKSHKNRHQRRARPCWPFWLPHRRCQRCALRIIKQVEAGVSAKVGLRRRSSRSRSRTRRRSCRWSSAVAMVGQCSPADSSKQRRQTIRRRTALAGRVQARFGCGLQTPDLTA